MVSDDLVAESWGYGKPVKTLTTHELTRALFVSTTPL